MKIGILGTRGIPNNYGGFEQFAEYLSVGLVSRGHQVTVYNPHFHPYKDSEFKGVKIIRKYSPEAKIGAAANFIYDFLCLRDALKRDFDIIYEAGYQSASISYPVLRVRKRRLPILVTNMDGMEWQRAKWSPTVKKLTRYFEKLGVRHSHEIISDNQGIADYFEKEYKTQSVVLEYGADLISSFDEKVVLSEYDLSPHGYFMLMARLEPENNIEMVIRAFKKSNCKEKLIVIGNHKSTFGESMVSLAKDDQRVQFRGGIYNKTHLDSLRYFAKAYLHGHSVGGTNPSLLEAMASQSFIFAHSNPYNRDVTKESAHYFATEEDLIGLLNKTDELRESDFEGFNQRNSERIENYYNWDSITNRHVRVFQNFLIK